MKEDLVSVIMCTYNGALFLKEQVDSIIAQTYTHLEIIIADDASTDATWPLLQAYASQDTRIKIFRHNKNTGYNLNFGFACAKATGAFIAIADQDDIWEEKKIEILVQEIKKNDNVVLVHCISARFEEDHKPHLRSLRLLNYFNGNDIRYFLLSNFVSGHNMLFRKKLLDASLPFPAKVYYDWWLVVYACVIGEVKSVEQILVWHRMHGQNATGAARPAIAFYKQVQLILPAILAIPDLPAVPKKLAQDLVAAYAVFPAKRFSTSLFWLLLKNARHVFAYKKRAFPWISYTKYALRYASRSTKA